MWSRFFDIFNLIHAFDAGSTEDIVGALASYSRAIIMIVVVLPQEAVATVISGADVVVDAGGHAYRANLTEGGGKPGLMVLSVLLWAAQTQRGRRYISGGSLAWIKIHSTVILFFCVQ